MRSLRWVGLLALVASGSFGLAFVAKGWTSDAAGAAASAAFQAQAPDSAKLMAMGINSGRQLVVYVLVSSRCGHCQRRDTKSAIRSIRNALQQNRTRDFSSATVIGIAIDADLSEGLDYLNTIGLSNFDEISVGNVWLNQYLTRLVWRDRIAQPAVPQVVVVSRDMTASLSPLAVKFGSDSVIIGLIGRNAILDWVRRGAPVIAETAAQSAPTKQIETMAVGVMSRIPQPLNGR